ncbi:hypothetical protein FQZ97_1040610 [compost metagenome]
MVLQFEQGIVIAAGLVLAVDLADDDLVLARHLLHRQDCAEIVVRAVVVPVAEGTVGLGFSQLAAGIAGVFGVRAVYRYPEADTAIGIAAEVLAFIAVVEAVGGDEGQGVDGRDRQVPGA